MVVTGKPTSPLTPLLRGEGKDQNPYRKNGSLPSQGRFRGVGLVDG